MKITSFNPFNKGIEELETLDLKILREVAEGWYVEYKSQLLDTKKIAKSFASFANHYGGWIFYGVEEMKDGSNRAGTFPGLEQSDITRLIERLRNAAKDTINPAPYYEYKVLEGPCKEIHLEEERAIVVVMVPGGTNPPYIHADGRIYRRIADSSDPKHETDRFTLDFLWKRGQQARTKLTKFLERTPEISDDEREISYIDVFLLPDPLQASGQISKIKFDQFRDLMGVTNEPGLHIPFDNFFSMSGGYIARQIATNNPYYHVLTWKHFFSGFSIVTIPLTACKINAVAEYAWLQGYENEQSMIDLLYRKQNNNSYMIDLSQLVVAVTTVIAQQRRLMKAGQIKGKLYAKTALHNIWRRIPFIDSKAYIEFVTNNRLPLIQSNSEFAPQYTTFESLRIIDEEQAESEHEQDIQISQYIEAFLFILDIFEALGIPEDIIFTSKESKVGELLLMGLRVPEVQAHRLRSTKSFI